MINTQIQGNTAAAPIKKILYFITGLLASLLLATSTSAESVNKNPVLSGKDIYMYGHLSSGKEVIATTVGDVKLTGKQAACVNCHRHSGMGSNEGSTLAPAITGEILFSEQKIKAHRYQALSRQTSSALDRQAYTKTSLRNTLSSGLDINGSPLNILMPRYIFDESNFDNLYAYLNSLSINDPGVTDTTLNIATIVDTRVDTKKIDTMVDTLKRYISDVNSKTRREDKRSEQAPIQKEWQYQGYRKFELHVWRLTGNPDTWRQQLDAYYDKTPVFAVTSGISRDSWNNVDKFCNDRKIPCILPNVKTPGFSINNFYSLYFNAGPYNDASISARYILSHPADNSQPKDILQLYDTASYSLKAKDTFNEKFVSDTNYQIKSEPIKDFINRNSINTHLKNKNTTIVIWSKELNKPLIDTLFRNKDKIKSVFIPYYLATSRESRKKLEGIDIEILASYPYIKPSSERRAIVRSNIWARSRKIDTTEKVIFTNTFTAINLLIDAIKDLRIHFNRAYLIELLEHMLDNAVLTGMYPKLTIGPGQRYASRGGYIVRIADDPALPLQPVSGWLLPEKQVKLTQQ